VRLIVYDLLGQEVAVLVDEQQLPGMRQATFDGATLSAGTYMYRLTVGSRAESRRMVLVK
jgi:serine protease AprX